MKARPALDRPNRSKNQLRPTARRGAAELAGGDRARCRPSASPFQPLLLKTPDCPEPKGCAGAQEAEQPN